MIMCDSFVLAQCDIFSTKALFK